MGGASRARDAYTCGGTDQAGWGTWTYRFVGSDGVIELGNDLVVKRPPPAKDPDTIPADIPPVG